MIIELKGYWSAQYEQIHYHNCTTFIYVVYVQLSQFNKLLVVYNVSHSKRLAPESLTTGGRNRSLHVLGQKKLQYDKQLTAGADTRLLSALFP